MNYEKFGKNRYRPVGDWVYTTIVVEVVGVSYRKRNARLFAAASKRAERKGRFYGVQLSSEPGNKFDEYAIAVYGFVDVWRLFRGVQRKRWQIGYLDRELAAELHKDLLSRDVPIAAELYSIYMSKDFYDFKLIVLAPPGYGHKARLRLR